jgi:hypothetical protein
LAVVVLKTDLADSCARFKAAAAAVADGARKKNIGGA